MDRLMAEMITKMVYLDAQQDILYRIYENYDADKRTTDEFYSYCATITGLHEDSVRNHLNPDKCAKEEEVYTVLSKAHTGEDLFYRLYLSDIDPHYIGFKLHMTSVEFNQKLDAVSDITQKKAYDELMKLEKRTTGEENFCRVYTTSLIAASIHDKLERYKALVKSGKTAEESANAVGKSVTDMQRYVDMDEDTLLGYAEKKMAEHIDPKTFQLKEGFEHISY